MTFLYNPDDEPEAFSYDGRSYILAPEDVTEIPEHAAAEQALRKFGHWGVVEVPGKTISPHLRAVSERLYLKATKVWAERHTFHRARETEFGSDVPEREDYKRAWTWLVKNADRLKEHGLA